MWQQRLSVIGLILCFNGPLFAKPTPDQKKEEKASFRSEYGVFDITARIVEVTEPYTFQDLRVDYTVRWNGKILPRSDLNGGTTWGCLYGDKHKMPDRVIEPLMLNKQQIGWSFNLLGICGNTTSTHTHWVVVWPEKKRENYQTKDFISKVKPLIVPNVPSGTATVWYLYQEWGQGGTAGSFFVPKVFELQAYKPNTYSAFGKASLPADIKAWPVFDDLPYVTASYIVAGIQSFDSTPIRVVMNGLPDQDKEHLKYVGLPNTAEELKKLADGLDAVKPTVKDFLHQD